MVFLRKEVDISGGDDAHQLAAHLARLRDRNTGEAMSYFGLKHIPNRVARTHHHWVCDKTLLKPLQTKRKPNQTELLSFVFSLSMCEKQQNSKISAKPNATHRTYND